MALYVQCRYMAIMTPIPTGGSSTSTSTAIGIAEFRMFLLVRDHDPADDPPVSDYMVATTSVPGRARVCGARTR